MRLLETQRDRLETLRDCLELETETLAPPTPTCTLGHLDLEHLETSNDHQRLLETTSDHPGLLETMGTLGVGAGNPPPPSPPIRGAGGLCWPIQVNQWI